MEMIGGHNTFEAGRTIERHFIRWFVENFSLVSCKKDWVVCSPELVVRGSKNTKWALVLMSSDSPDDEILFILKRIDVDTEPKDIWVDFEANFMVNGGILAHYELDCPMKLLEHRMRVISKDSYREKLTLLEQDTLEIDLTMVVYDDCTKHVYEVCSDVGLKSLSENLYNNLYCAKTYHDIEIKVGDHTIMAHKAILQARSKMLKLFVRMGVSETTLHSNEIVKVVLPDFKYEELQCIMKYLYSGDLKHILEKPSVSLLAYAEDFDITGINYFYLAYHPTFRTSVEVRECTAKIKIADLNAAFENQSPISSPVFSEIEFNTKWQVHFYPRCQEDMDYICLIAENLDEMFSLDASVEFFTVKSTGELLSNGRQFSDNNAKKFTFMKFAKRDEVRYYTTDALDLWLKFRLSHGNKNTVVENEVIPFKFPCIPDLPFKLLSADLGELLDSGLYSDYKLKSNEQLFPIHRCILSSGSSVFRKILSETDDAEGIIDVSSKTTPSELSMLLTFIYKGILPHFSKYKEFFAAAQKFGLSF